MIPSETWRKVRDSYIRGEGRLRTVADQHGLRAGTVERRAAIEDWSRLRREFETGELSKLLPSPPAMPPLPPPIPDGAVSEEFLRNRMQAYYRDNSRQFDVIRAHLAKALDVENPDPEKLRSLTVTLNLLIEAEAKLLGLRNRGRTPKKEPDHRRLGFAEPLWNPILRGTSTVVLHGLDHGLLEGIRWTRSGWSLSFVLGGAWARSRQIVHLLRPIRCYRFCHSVAAFDERASIRPRSGYMLILY